MTALTMKREDLLTVDNAILTALAILALIFGWLALAPARLELNDEESEPVAVISVIGNKVKRKAASALAWNSASTQDPLRAGDQIFTAKEANARVRFDDGAEIDIAENSLIKIERKGDKTTIDLSKGFVSGKVGGTGGGSFAIKMGSTKINLAKGAAVQIKVDPNDRSKNTVALISGKAAVAGSSGPVELKKDEVLTLDAKTGAAIVEQVEVKPVVPSMDQKFDADNSPTILFRWEARRSLGTYRVTVARDAGFRDVITSRETQDTAATLNAPTSGLYFWKVTVTANGKAVESVTHRFQVLSLSPPDLLTPVGGKRFTYDEGQRRETLSFVWRSDEPQKGYEIEIARDPEFKNIITKQTVSGVSYEKSDLGEGNYYWRVRSLGEDELKASKFSAAAAFELEKRRLLIAPADLKPATGRRVPMGSQVPLAWSSVASADGYAVEISKSADFKSSSLVLDERTTVPTLPWTAEQAGRYYWRVRATTVNGKEGPRSEPRSLLVDAAPPRLGTPQDLTEMTLGEQVIDLEFTWEGDVGPAGFVIEVASDPQFQKAIIRKNVTARRFKWVAGKPAIYYWRVGALSGDGKDASYSAPRSFAIKKLELLPPPDLEERYDLRLSPPQPGSAWYVPLQKRRNDRWWAVLLDALMATSTAAAQTAKAPGLVRIEWDAVSGADSYDVELAREQSFTKPLVKQRVKQAAWAWAQAIPGTYYLRAASIDASGRRGPFSRTSLVHVTYAAPPLYEPKGDQAVKLDSAATGVVFRWMNTPAAKSFLLEIATDEAFTKTSEKKTVQNGEAQLPLPPGRYFWRIGARYGNELVRSEPRFFSLDQDALSTPQPSSPLQDQTLTRASAAEKTELAWEKVAGGASFELEVAQQPSFKNVVTKMTTKTPALQLDETLPDGTYYWRVRSVGAPVKGAAPRRSGFSATRSFKLRTKPGAPKIEKPAPGASFAYLQGDEIPAVEVAWTGASPRYELEITQSDSQKLVKRLASTATSSKLAIPPGDYRARVRGLPAVDASDQDKAALTTSYSEMHAFSIKERDRDPPELVYPEDGGTVPRTPKQRLSWSKVAGFDGYKLVVSRDPSFKKVVATQTVESDTAVVSLPVGGKYYWYVEGQGKGRNARLYAARSEVQRFTIAVPQAETYGGETLRLEAAYAPSLITNSMASPQVTNSLSVAVLNSFAVNGSYWVKSHLGVEGAYHRKSTTLYDEAGTLQGSSDQKPLPYDPQELDLRAKYRFRFGKTPLAPEIHLRSGYRYKTFFSYFATSRTSLGLVETATQNLCFGLGTRMPITYTSGFEAAADYAMPISATPVALTSGSHLLADLNYRILLPSRMAATLGYRYGAGSYTFADQEHGVNGTLQETTHSLLGGIGYGF